MPVDTRDEEPDFVASLQGVAAFCETAIRDGGMKPDDLQIVVGKLRAAAFVVDQLAKLRDTLAADKRRLDFLDALNARLNAQTGARYAWKMVINPNVNRLMLGDLKVDLQDAEARGLPSCRGAIDVEMARMAATRVRPSPPEPDLLAVAKAYEAWEAEVVFGGNWNEGIPTLTQPLFDRLLEIQAMRNAALAACSTASSTTAMPESRR